MADTHDPEVRTAPSPLPPTEAELTAWHALSRDEQLTRYRQALHQADCDRISGATMNDVLAAARQTSATRRRG